MIRVLIADDMKEYRDHFRMLLENERDIEVIGTASGEEEVISLAQELNPDIILMDIQMDSDNSGIKAMKEILAVNPDIKIIMLTIHSERDNVINSYEAGAVDFVEKTASVTELLNTVRGCTDENNRPNKINHMIVEEFVKLKKERDSVIYIISMLSRLSRTEVEILKAVSEGKKYREIAQERFVEEVTIRAMASKICSKMEMRPLKEIVRTIERLGLSDLFNEMTKKEGRKFE